ncbi:hypothetical protein BD289DRAFT_377888 [Coniella lustricola]|uniref:Xylanolytic transcriptional activator regulatory domain-containing protein n=1 Tax=Coniella lustricola TaxID=2025994 RepID=A0A2T2ZUU8_9PEZI|nr:hypothetical protein BD289DRAFT_377888 [Coniella lustricola]
MSQSQSQSQSQCDSDQQPTQQQPSPSPPPPPPPTAAPSSGHKARRPRAARACNLCRVKKNKCDELYPCTYCRSDYVRSLEDRVRQLSAALEAQKATPTSHQPEEASPSLSSLTNVNAGGASRCQPSPSAESAYGASPVRPRLAGHELTAVNKHTHNVEFYGSSSSVVLLSEAQYGRYQDAHDDGANHDEHQAESDAAAAFLLSSLHNTSFSPRQVDTGLEAPSAHAMTDKTTPTFVEATHFRQCSVFLHNFFSTLHYIHPILDKSSFLESCEVLWSGDEQAINDHASFVPLYYSVLSLGALVGYRDAELIGGITNVQWSRKFFKEARSRFTSLEVVTDLEMVQAQFFLAKVCQNELNSHWSYSYTGLAGRTALAMGINRQPSPHSRKSPALLKAEARTWWGLYSLEEQLTPCHRELSFAMGRPSSLGTDDYHNRDFPFTEISELPSPADLDMLDPPHCAIIKHMAHLSRITRHLCIQIYLKQHPLPRTVEVAQHIEQILDEWLEGLPETIRPRQSLDPSIINSTKEAIWMKRQRLVLHIRYLNLKILTYSSILLTSTHLERIQIPGAYEATQRCLQSAKETIELIHEQYKHQEFFRTWFYNTTYTIFAASVILVYVNQEFSHAEVQSLFQYINMAIEILQSMAEDCVVAGKSAQLLQKALDRALAIHHQRDSERLAGTLMSMAGRPHEDRQPIPRAAPVMQMDPLYNSHASEASRGHGSLDSGGPWLDPEMNINWMHCWAPVSLLDNDMLDTDLNLPFMGFEGAVPGQNPRPG